MDKIDNETKDIIDNDRKVEDFVMSEGWQVIKCMFNDEIMQLQSVRNVDMSLDPIKMSIDITARNQAISILFEFIQRVEGTADKSKAQKDVFIKPSYIVER